MAFSSTGFAAKMEDLNKQSTPIMVYLSKVLAAKTNNLSKNSTPKIVSN